MGMKNTAINKMNKTFTISQLIPWAALIVIAVLFFIKGCFLPAVQPTVTTVIKTDTVEKIIQGTAPQVQPIIIKTDAANPVVIPSQYQQPSTDLKELTQQVKDLAAQLYAINHYDNTVKLKDSSGKEVGEVNLKQDVSVNQLQPFTPTYKLSLPVITKTIETTIKEGYNPKNSLFIGAGIIGDQSSILRSLKAGLLFKNKKDAVLELSATRSLRDWGGEVSIYKKIF